MSHRTDDKVKMVDLKRSFTTRHESTKKPSRPRASSFTNLFRRESSSPLHTLNHDTLSSSLLPSSLSPPPPPPSRLYPSSSSFLSVQDSHTGGASSIDSGSDEDDDNQDEPTFMKKPNVQIPPTTKPPPPAPSSAPPLEKKLSTTFKEKLSLARRSQSAKRPTSQNVFHLWKQQQSSTLKERRFKLYDDGKGVYPPPQTTDQNRRDAYGFTRSTQWVTTEEYEAFEDHYQPITQRRSQKWRTLLEDNHGEWPQRSSKFKRYIRKGIPPEFRRQAWLHYSGGETKMKANVGVYPTCVQKALDGKSEYLDIIERGKFDGCPMNWRTDSLFLYLDLHRTFPDNANFRSTSTSASAGVPRPHADDQPAIQALRRVLYAFSVYSPSIGYCQSLNYIAGLLLLFMSEEEAFWTLVVLVHELLPPNVYDVTMEGASIDQAVLMMLISERCPLIWQRLAAGRSFWECEAVEAGMPTSSLVTSHWFLTLFINILPTESVLRVWDCLFYEGRRALMRVALAVFKINEHELLAVTDPLEVFQVVQNMPKRMLDCHYLMDATFHKYASVTRISDQDLERRRQMFKARRDERRNTTSTPALKRGVAGSLLVKAKERLVERAKTVRHK